MPFGLPPDELPGALPPACSARCPSPAARPGDSPSGRTPLSLIERCSDASQRILPGCNPQIHYVVGVGLTVELDCLMKAIDPPAATPLAPLAEVLLWALRSMYLWSRGRSAEAAAAAENGSRLAGASGVRVWDDLC
ncbi:MAG: hypothetical protein IPJ27_24510 [Candidatus Accumulibacter sp.]|uniref:Uncharacterized protein n=1 Tax=Candidatus Accumulibacter proximus TaxID=2954385 RepID=A0A935Q2B8_9PROT|nr:hypothetical protein [Candidatus Accumulibacter proximus]